MAGLKKGDVHHARLGRPTGREQASARPVVILQANGMATWATVLVAPLSTSARATSFRPGVTLGGTRGLVLVDQMRALDAGRIGRRLGSVGADESVEIDTAVRLVLGLR